MHDTTLPVTPTWHDLGSGASFGVTDLPASLIWDAARFEEAWALHPPEKHRILMYGVWVETPRWQQLYGRAYQYPGGGEAVRPVPPVLQPLHAWVGRAVDGRLNGSLVNWYEGPEHYIGPHHDSTKNLVPDAPIVTVSFGETRVFRLTRGSGAARQVRDFPAPNGTVFVLPPATNAAWKHAVPKSARYRGRRISVTFRAFVDGG